MKPVRLLTVICLTLGLLGGRAVAADMDVPRATSTPHSTAAPKDIPIQQNQPNCSHWTDDCVTCTRGANNEAPTCSNIGFACQPKAIRCIGGDTPQGQLPK